MPVKIRNPKRRADPEVEMQEWADVFLHGRDLVGSLRDVLPPDPHTSRRSDPIDGGAARILAREAWSRLGRKFLTSPLWLEESEWFRHPRYYGYTQTEPRKPWAQEQFGNPRG